MTARSYATPWTQYVHDANISAFIEFENGVICNYVLAHDATMAQWRISLQGERGALVLTNHNELRFYPKPGQQLGTAEAESVACDVMDFDSPEMCMAEDFFRYVVEDIEPGISGRRNLRTMAMCEALVRSAKNKRPVELSELK